jgi:hypothetical protein
MLWLQCGWHGMQFHACLKPGPVRPPNWIAVQCATPHPLQTRLGPIVEYHVEKRDLTIVASALREQCYRALLQAHTEHGPWRMRLPTSM